MDKYLYWLANVGGLGTAGRERLLEAFGTGAAVYGAQEKHLAMVLEKNKLESLLEMRKSWDVDREYAQLQEKQISFICTADEEYPEKLRNIPDHPFGIYCKGRMPQPQKLSVAVVGARECSDYGRFIATELGRELGEAGIQVISGMARGIDGISQLAALDAGGESYAVLGNGVDICYPRDNRPIYDRMLVQGGILSTYPPGTAPKPQLFPPRNRIVSGLADVLVVVEARQKSGTLITVDMALEQGREVYAVPGRITDRLSDGCNKLVKDGALVFLSPRDFMEGLRQSFSEKLAYCTPKQAKTAEGPTLPPITPEEAVVLETLDMYPQPLERIRDQLQVKLTERGFRTFSNNLLTILMHLCLKGVAKQNSPGWFSLDI
ncbi:MAG: DNA-protecting protein DprA [Lachnospiraceae bacterium]|nr:DNA-protecting protein DprA [Lachnospiraceae bacterium]